MSQRAAAASATLALLLVAAGEPSVDGWEVLRRALDASADLPFSGEVLVVSYDDGEAHVARTHVTHAAAPPDAALPARGTAPAVDLSRLERNYDVVHTGLVRVFDRRCDRLEIRRRRDGELRERLWIDRASGLAVRRETYARDDLVRLTAFLTLDLDGTDRPDAEPTGSGEPAGAALTARQIGALRRGGWVVPRLLPGGFELAGAYLVEVDGAAPLQLVYDDGLYTVSLFQQVGRPDPGSLPAGSRTVDGGGVERYEWPGALPSRLVWAAAGRTWSLVGDATPDDLRAAVAALPSPERPSVVQRFLRGLGRLWSWVSPWK